MKENMYQCIKFQTAKFIMKMKNGCRLLTCWFRHTEAIAAYWYQAFFSFYFQNQIALKKVACWVFLSSSQNISKLNNQLITYSSVTNLITNVSPSIFYFKILAFSFSALFKSIYKAWWHILMACGQFSNSISIHFDHYITAFELR